MLPTANRDVALLCFLWVLLGKAYFVCPYRSNLFQLNFKIIHNLVDYFKLQYSLTKKTDNNKGWQKRAEIGTLIYCWGKWKAVQLLLKTIWLFFSLFILLCYVSVM